MNVEAFTNGFGHQVGQISRDSCLPHQFTALSSDPKRGKARSELYYQRRGVGKVRDLNTLGMPTPKQAKGMTGQWHR